MTTAEANLQGGVTARPGGPSRAEPCRVRGGKTICASDEDACQSYSDRSHIGDASIYAQQVALWTAVNASTA